MNKSLFCSLILIFQLFIFNYSNAQNIKIAVLDFKSNSSEISSGDAVTLTEKFISTITQFKGYDVLERSEIQNIIKEQDFSLSDISESAVAAGKLLSAEIIISGKVGKIGKIYNISVRMLDIKSGKIIKSINKDYKGEIEGLSNEIQIIANDLFDITPINSEIVYQLFRKDLDDTTKASIYDIILGSFSENKSKESLVVIKHKDQWIYGGAQSPVLSLWLLKVKDKEWKIEKKIASCREYLWDCCNSSRLPDDYNDDCKNEPNIEPGYKIIDINNDGIFELMILRYNDAQGYCSKSITISSINGDTIFNTEIFDNADNYFVNTLNEDLDYLSYFCEHENSNYLDSLDFYDHRKIDFIDLNKDSIYEISEKIVRLRITCKEHYKLFIDNTYALENNKYKLIKSEQKRYIIKSNKD